jgi:hypothetical protein
MQQRVALARALVYRRACCSWTSRSPRWTSGCARRCGTSCGPSSDRSGSHGVRHPRPGRGARALPIGSR